MPSYVVNLQATHTYIYIYIYIHTFFSAMCSRDLVVYAVDPWGA
jgi:hypothetical protein